MYHIAVLLEHVDFFDCLDGLDIELLEGCLQFLVVGAGGLVLFLHFAPVCTCTAIMHVSSYTSWCYVRPEQLVEASKEAGLPTL